MKDRKTYKILTRCSFFPINRFYIVKTEGVILRNLTMNLFLWVGLVICYIWIKLLTKRWQSVVI